jgi:SAM-dependent methyltransferase
MERDQRRLLFEEVPQLYDQARPTYPEDAFDELAALTDLRAGARVLEIGCGPGKATLPMARRGYELLCVELGAGLAAVARRNLAEHPNVEIVNANFETWEPERGDFDAVVAFTALHWIDPELRYAKPARLLRDGGHIAAVGTKHVRRSDGEDFWIEVQEDYEAVSPDEDRGPPPLPDELESLQEEFEADGLFEYVAWRTYLWDETYTADEYIALLDTYSRNRAREAEQREELYARICRRIERQPSRSVTKTYLALLNVARRRG